MSRPSVDAELKALIPPLADAELERLEQNLLEEGCREPLITWRGLLLDGHHRLEICEKHGLPYETRALDLPDRAAAESWMIRNQLGRRNLTREQFTVLLGWRYLKEKRQGERTDLTSGQSDPKSDRTSARIAAEHNVSEKTVRRAAATVESLPEMTPAEQAQALATAREIKRQRRRERDEQCEAERAAILATDHPLDGAGYRLFTYAVNGGNPPDMPRPNAIVTDPPYPEKYLPVWRDLFRLAADILPDGGSLLALSGQAHLPEVLSFAQDSGMAYQWTLAYFTPGQSTQAFGRRVKCNWKPLLWFVRGGYFGEHVEDTITSGENDKSRHEWGQSVSGMAAVIERFTIPGKIVYDPFMGAGSTGEAALRTGRLFIGSDVDEAWVKTSAERLAKVAS